MTYCLGIILREGLVMASDSRSNASLDDVNVCQKMHTIVDPSECVFILLTSGNLSCSQSILTLLRRDFDQGKGLASALFLLHGILAFVFITGPSLRRRLSRRLSELGQVSVRTKSRPGQRQVGHPLQADP